MMTSRPPLFYWMPASLTVMQAVRDWRAEGLNVCYTLDAGPNVHCICTAQDAPHVLARLSAIEGVQNVLQAGVGTGATILP
jgi:diphosphomevalonate decarboxylase